MIEEYKTINYFDLEIRQGNLPHWEQDEVIYFVTFRLADSIPQNKLNQLKQEQKNWLNTHSEPYSGLELKKYFELFNDRVYNWLDQGFGSCVLKNAEVSNIVADAICFFDRQRYFLDEWVVMPNHVHILVKVSPQYSLPKITHSWKSFTAHKINSFFDRQGDVWMDESYDHIIRSKEELEFIRHYIKNNPEKAKYKAKHASWLSSE